MESSPTPSSSDANKHLKVEPIKINLNRGMQQPQNSSPKITIKPIVRPASEIPLSTCESIPKLTIRVPPPHQDINCVNDNDTQQHNNCNKKASKHVNNDISETQTVPKLTIRSVVAPSCSSSNNSNNHTTNENVVPKLTIKVDNTQNYNCEGGGTPTKMSIKKYEDGNKFTIVTNSKVDSPPPPLPKLTIKTNSNDLSCEAMIVPNSSSVKLSTSSQCGQLSPIPKVTIKSIPKQPSLLSSSSTSSSLASEQILTVPKLTLKSIRNVSDDPMNEAIPKFTIKTKSSEKENNVVDILDDDDDEDDCIIIENNVVPKLKVKLSKENNDEHSVIDSISSSAPKMNIKNLLMNEVSKSHRSKDTIATITSPSSSLSLSSSSSSSSLTSEILEPQLTVPKLTIRSKKIDEDAAIVIPKVTIKSVGNTNNHLDDNQDIVISPKVTIKPIPKPIDSMQPLEVVTNSISNASLFERGQDSPRIVLKISKKDQESSVAAITTLHGSKNNVTSAESSSSYNITNDEIPSSNQSSSTTSSLASSPSSSSNLVSSTNTTTICTKNDLKRAALSSNDDDDDVVEVKKIKFSSPNVQNDTVAIVSSTTSTAVTPVVISLISPQLAPQITEQTETLHSSSRYNIPFQNLMPTPPPTQQNVKDDEKMEIFNIDDMDDVQIIEDDNDIQIITNDNETSNNTVSSLSTTTTEPNHIQFHHRIENSMESQPPQPLLCIQPEDDSNSTTNQTIQSSDDLQDPLGAIASSLTGPTPPSSQSNRVTNHINNIIMDKDVLDFQRELEIQMATPIKRPRGRPKKVKIKVEENGIASKMQSKITTLSTLSHVNKVSASAAKHGTRSKGSNIATETTEISLPSATPFIKDMSVVIDPFIPPRSETPVDSGINEQLDQLTPDRNNDENSNATDEAKDSTSKDDKKPLRINRSEYLIL